MSAHRSPSPRPHRGRQRDARRLAAEAGISYLQAAALLTDASALDDYRRIDNLDELWFNNFAEGFYSQAGVKRAVRSPFADQAAFVRYLQALASVNGLRLTADKPTLDAVLNDGTRLNAALPPAGGPCFCLRPPARNIRSMADLVASATLTPELVEDLRGWADAGRSILICGDVATGKTSLLQALAGERLPGRRVAVVEAVPELHVDGPDVTYLRPAHGDGDLREMIRRLLRMRPDQVIVSEMTGREVHDLLEAATLSMQMVTTIHASSALQAVCRTQALAAGEGGSREHARTLVRQTVDIVICLSSEPGSGVRRVIEVAEMLAGDTPVPPRDRDPAAQDDPALALRTLYARSGDRLVKVNASLRP